MSMVYATSYVNKARKNEVEWSGKAQMKKTQFMTVER